MYSFIPIQVSYQQTANVQYTSDCPHFAIVYGIPGCCTLVYDHLNNPGTFTKPTLIAGGSNNYLRIDSSTNGCTTSLSVTFNFDCAAIDANCDACNSYTSCTSCIAGYYVAASSPICRACTLTNCLDCSSSSTCTVCAANFAISAGGSCVTCDVAFSNCQSCTSTACTACTTNSYAIDASGHCSLCTTFPSMSACVTCSSNTTCLTCSSDSYALDSTGKCSFCTTFSGMLNCATCSSNTTCLTCPNSNYALDGHSKCVLCSSFPGMAGCQTCSGSGVCLTCSSNNYAKDATSKCLLCSTFMNNCQTCSSNATCLTCSLTTYAIDATAKCSLCSSFAGMTNCQTCSNNNTCLTCSTTTYAIDATAKCSLCTTFAGMANCQTCSNNNTCLTCSSTNYALDATAKCSLCNSFVVLSNCQTCTNNVTCTACSSTTYALGATAKCALCSTFSGMLNCATCSSNTTCLTCSSTNYALDATAKCSLCSSFAGMTNCQTCSNNNTCLTCSSTTYAIDATAKCSLCTTFAGMLNCATCSSNTTCLTCSSTSYALDATAKCALCSSFPALANCQTCSNNVTCTGCSSNTYALGSSPGCFLCNSFAGMSNCLTCSNNATCLTCTSTSYVINLSNKCELCSVPLPNCATCSSRTACLSCNVGYAFDSLNSCKTCSFFLGNCVTCSSNSTCLTCDPGYAIQAGLCKPCSEIFPHCSWCTSNTSCTTCDPGYTVNWGECETCDTFMIHCGQCTSQTVCTSCSDPYDVGSNQKCTSCKLPLYYTSRFCQDDANCVSAFQAVNNTVVCMYCDTQKHFVLNENKKCVCMMGFELVNGVCQDVCGDGLIFTSECDDNNTRNKDGCSAECKQETDFLCTKTPEGTGKCKLNQNIVLKLDFIEKVISENKGLIYLSLNSDNENVQAYYQSILFDYTTTSNRSDTISIVNKYMNENGQIVIEIGYNETIENSMIALSFVYEKEHLISQDHILKFQLKGRNYPLVVSTHFDEYQQISEIEFYIVICFYVFVIVFLLSDKFIAVEGLNALQMVYFSLLLIQTKWPHAFSTVLPLKYSMGFNQLIYEEKSNSNIADEQYKKFRYLSMSECFLMNNLTNSVVLMGLSAVFLALFIFKTKKETTKNHTKDKKVNKQLTQFFVKFRPIYKKIYNITFHFSYIMFFQLFVSLYIEASFMKNVSKPVKLLSKFCAMWLFMAMIFTFVENFRHFFLSSQDTVVETFRVGIVEARYKKIYLCYVFINVVGIVLLNDKLFFGVSITVVLLGLAIIYMIFLIFYRPYRYSFTIHTFTILANQAIYMLTLGLITLVNMEVELEEDYLLMFCYTLLGFCILIVVFTVIRVYLDFRHGQSQVDEQVNKQVKEIEEKEKVSFLKQPLYNHKGQRTHENPYRMENQALKDEQIDFLNDLKKKKFLSEWQKDRAYYHMFKQKPLEWVRQNQKDAKYEYLLKKQIEAMEASAYQMEMKKKKEQKMGDAKYNEDLKYLKDKMRNQYNAKKQVKEKLRMEKRNQRYLLKNIQGDDKEISRTKSKFKRDQKSKKRNEKV